MNNIDFYFTLIAFAGSLFLHGVYHFSVVPLTFTIILWAITVMSCALLMMDNFYNRL